jgi:hypothetical protein
MRKHPLVTLSACGFLSIGGIAALLDTGSTSRVLATRFNTDLNALHQNGSAAGEHIGPRYQLDGYYIAQRADLERRVLERPAASSHRDAQLAVRQLGLALYQRDLVRRAAARARHEAAVRRAQAAAAKAKAAAQAAAEAAAAAAAAQAAAAAAKPAPAPRPAPKPRPVHKPVHKPVPKPVRHPRPRPNPGPAGGVWYELRMCESGDDYSINTGNGYYGAYQFSLSTWYSLGYTGLPSNAPPYVQDAAAQKLQAEAGWGQWPACSAQLGL